MVYGENHSFYSKISFIHRNQFLLELWRPEDFGAKKALRNPLVQLLPFTDRKTRGHNGLYSAVAQCIMGAVLTTWILKGKHKKGVCMWGAQN